MNYVPQVGNTCIIASLAMVWTVKFEDVIRLLGHDGLEPTFPESKYPERGIHSQEIMDTAYKAGFAMVIIQAAPVHGPQDGKGSRTLDTQKLMDYRFNKYLENRNSVLIGENIKGVSHAVAYDGKQVLDPAIPVPYELDKFHVREAWQFYLIK